MNLDDSVCLCFRVTKRKLVNFVRRELPTVPSQLSQCGGAGTGCGWCVPFLRQIFHQNIGAATELDQLTVEEYAGRRAAYVRSGKGTPPPGATPLASDENHSS
jgi:NAD(P)H-nitrite reductase large subunit